MRSRVPERLETPTCTSGEPACGTATPCAAPALIRAMRAASSSWRAAQSRCPARWPPISTATQGTGGCRAAIRCWGSFAMASVPSSAATARKRGRPPERKADGPFRRDPPDLTGHERHGLVSGVAGEVAATTARPPAPGPIPETVLPMTIGVQKREVKSTIRWSTESGGPAISSADIQRMPNAVFSATP